MKIERYLQPINLNLPFDFLRKIPNPKRNYIKPSKFYEPNGNRECARRRGQIYHRQLTLDNGLVYEPITGSI